MRMTRPLLGLAAALLASGCVIGPDRAQSAGAAGDGSLDISLEINFNGTADCYAAGVDEVSATFSDGALSSATVPCNASEGIAIAYQSVVPGTYTVTLEGLRNGAIVYAGQGTFQVAFDQPTTFSFDLPESTGAVMPPTGDTATVTLDFSFGATAVNPGMDCQEARVTSVNVSVDGAPAQSVPCHDATANTDSATMTGVPLGTHTYDLSVTDSGGNVLYHSTLAGEKAVAGSDNQIRANLAGVAYGGLQLQWLFSDQPDCTSAMVSHVQYVLDGPNGQVAAQSAAPCTDGSITFDQASGQPLVAGVYTLASMTGVDADNNPVYSSGSVSNLYVPAGAVQGFQITLAPPK